MALLGTGGLRAQVPSGLAPNVLRTHSGTQDGAQFGRSFSTVGDVNADGYDDIAVGSPDADFAADSAGQVLVFSGLDGAVLYSWDGESAVDQYGWSVGAAGDTNGDGYADVIIGAIGTDSGAATNSGSIEVRSGRDGSVLLTVNGTSPFEILGWAVAGAGDLDGDGFDDVLVGAPGFDGVGSSSGRVAAWSIERALRIHSWEGAEPLAHFGHDVASVGDLDGDHVPDLVVGSPFADGPFVDTGDARVLSGATGALLFTVVGTTIEGYLGWSVGGTGDLDGDGFADWVAGSPYHQVGFSPRGQVQVFSGLDASVLYHVEGTATLERMGWSVSGSQDLDLNADGVPDLVLGAPGAVPAGASGANFGRVTAVSGLDFQELFVVEGDASGDALGEITANSGDSNANGYAEVLAGSSLVDKAPIGQNVGRLHVLELAGTLPDRARSRSLGAGCRGSHGGLSRLDLNRQPRLGATVDVSLRSAPPNLGFPALLAIDGLPVQIDLDVLGSEGCVLRTPTGFGLQATVDSSGRASVPLAIPGDPALAGTPAFLQWVLIDISTLGVPQVVVSDAAVLLPGY